MYVGPLVGVSTQPAGWPTVVYSSPCSSYVGTSDTIVGTPRSSEEAVAGCHAETGLATLRGLTLCCMKHGRRTFAETRSKAGAQLVTRC